MATSPDPLAALRPERLPATVPGSLVETVALAAAAGVAAALLAVAAIVIWRALARRRSPRGEARAALAAAAGLPIDERIAAEARLLRAYVGRVAGAEAAREEDAAWLARLDHVFATTFFSTGQGRLFGAALYAPANDADPAQADAGVRRLFGRR
jgi:hypothetical protein